MKTDYTFATRLKSFVQAIQVNDLMSEEEKEYILRTCDEMIAIQAKGTYKEILSKITCNGMRELTKERAEQAAEEYANQRPIGGGMKTVEKYIESEYGSQHFQRTVALRDYVSLRDLMQEYGDYLASACMDQVLKDAAENAEMIYHDGVNKGNCRRKHITINADNIQIDKQSILDTKKKLP